MCKRSSYVLSECDTYFLSFSGRGHIQGVVETVLICSLRKFFYDDKTPNIIKYRILQMKSRVKLES